jgi:hypothetical protein
MGKNIVVRLHVYLMCFLLAFSPAYAYASAAPKLDFSAVSNFVRTSSGAAADFLFKRSANDPNYNAANDDYFETKNHKVTNSQLGKVGFNRILGLTPYGLVGSIATGFVVGELVTALNEQGWIVDRANQEIYKPAGFQYCLRQNSKYVTSPTQFCADLPTAAVALYIAHVNPREKQSKVFLNGNGVQTQGTYTALSSPRQISITDTNAEVRAKIVEISEGYTSPPVDQQFFLDAKPVGKIVATPDDVAEVLPNVSDKQIKELMGSPDFAFEKHAPAAAAAAKAEPKSGSDSCPAGQSKVNGVCQPPQPDTKCPAGQSLDPSTGKCKSATAAQCPVGQIYDLVEKKCKKIGLPDDDDDDWPEFCEWAAPVCEFIEWAKQDVDKFEAEKVEVEDTADDAQSITSQILTLGYVSGGVKACPSNEDLSFEFMGQSIGFELSYAPLCEMLLTARPVVIAIAYFQAAKIVFVGRRD